MMSSEKTSGEQTSNKERAQERLVDPARWLEEYGDFLFNYAVMHLRDDSLAEELVQDTFVSALRSAESFKGLSSERSWLVAILKHKIIDYIRKVSRERKYFDLNEDPELSQTFNEIGHWNVEPDAWPGNPESAFEQKAFFEQLNSCVEKLPDQQQMVFVLREYGELSTEEICKSVGVSPTNLWVLLHRARMRLRQCLETNWFGLNTDGKRK